MATLECIITSEANFSLAQGQKNATPEKKEIHCGLRK